MESINKQISVLYRMSQIYINKKLKAYGLNHSQIATLMFVSKGELVTQNMICDHLSLDKGTVSAMIKKLVSNGYLTKLPHPSDKRASMVKLSYKSTLLLDQITNADSMLSEGIMDGFSKQEQKTVKDFLTKMQNNIEFMTDLQLQVS